MLLRIAKGTSNYLGALGTKRRRDYYTAVTGDCQRRESITGIGFLSLSMLQKRQKGLSLMPFFRIPGPPGQFNAERRQHQ